MASAPDNPRLRDFGWAAIWLGGAAVFFVAGWLVAPTLVQPIAKVLGDLFARNSDVTDTPRRFVELFVTLALLTAGLGISAIAALLRRPATAAIALSVTTLVAALAMADAPDFFAGLAESGVIHKGATELAELTARGALAVVLAIVAALVIWRADKLLYVTSVVGVMAAAALLLGAFAGVLGSLEAAPEGPTTTISVTGRPLGNMPSSESGEIAVIFIRPTVSAEGATTGFTPHRWTGTVEDLVTCEPDECTITLVVKRGDADADLGKLLADQAAAVVTYLVVPEPVSDAAGGASPSE